MFGLDNLVDMLFDSAMEKLSRNERVIQLLQRLKLDPDHPPADFTGVYKYALVEYGVGKPRPALDIFRQSEIQQLFREALEQNNPAKLLQNGEAFLADHPLQVDLQANNVDVRREFYAFAAVFIEVAKRTRTPAEILAQQKLESLHRQIGSVQERLNRLPTIEGLRTEMARLAATSYPALPGNIAFSAEQCKAFALAQQMRGWFETLGFDLESHEVWQDNYFEWIINIPVRRGRYDRILVRGIDGEAGLRDVEALKQSVETHRTDEGWLVTARRISRAARDEIEKTENDGLGCYTLDELLDQDADFSGYLTWLEAEIQKCGIAEKYVPLACLKEELDPDTQQRIGVSRYDERDGWIDGYIDLWLDDPAKEHISVLGEFGTGKTWFALHYAWKALQRYRKAQRRGLERPRLPLIIPLRDYAKAVSVESLFSEFFFRKHEIPIPGYSAFEQLNRMGKLLLIFDGFDEMAARVDRQEMINNFWELAKVVVPGAKVILTCRTEHFPEAKEGRALLNAELQASTRDLTGETPQFEVLELEKFNDEQIRQVLSHQAQPATVEQIMGNPQLLDLARRPVLTELILEALPDIEAGKPVDMSRVYLYAVRHKMERDIKEERTFTSMADKLYFMCELSWEMLSTDRMSINYREFPDRIRKLFGPAVQEQKDLDHWHYDMMGQTMLIRNAAGDYSPAHRALLEFFAAYKLAAELGILHEDFYEIVRSSSHVNFNREPKKYSWSSYFESLVEQSNLSEKLFIGPIQEFLTDDFRKIQTSFGYSQLSKAVTDLLIPMTTKENNKLNSLVSYLLDESRESKSKAASYVIGNIVTLMAILSPINLNRKFSGISISGAKFLSLSLNKMDFSNSVIAESIFQDSQFLAANFSGVTVSNSDFIRCNVDSSIFSRATLSNCDFQNTTLLECDFSGSNLTNITFQDVSLKSANFTHASLSNAKFLEEFESNAVLFDILSNDLIYSGGENGNVYAWDAFSHMEIFMQNSHASSINHLCLHPNNRYLASSDDTGTVNILDLKNRKNLSKINTGEDQAFEISFSSDGCFLATTGMSGLVKVWSFSKDEVELISTLDSGNYISQTVSFFNKDKSLVCGGAEGNIRIWNWQEEKILMECELEDLEEPSGIHGLSISPDEKFIAVGAYEEGLILYKSDTLEKVWQRKFSDFIYHPIFSSDASLIFAGSRADGILVFATQSGCELKVLPTEALCACINLSSDNSILASASEKCIQLWDTRLFVSEQESQFTPNPGYSLEANREINLQSEQLRACGIQIPQGHLPNLDFGKCLQEIWHHIDCQGMILNGCQGLDQDNFLQAKTRYFNTNNTDEYIKKEREKYYGSLRDWLRERGADI